MEQREMSGIIFANKKEKDSQPDMKGYLTINGVALEQALWKRTDKNGKEFWSVKYQPPREKKKDAEDEGRDAKAESPSEPEVKAEVVEPDDDNLPF